MHENSIKVYFQGKSIKPWFYIQVGLVIIFLSAIIFLVIDDLVQNRSISNWFWLIQGFIGFISADRLVKEYKSSKGNRFFIQVNEEGISWILPDSTYTGKQIIVWPDIKYLKISNHDLTVTYLSTYFKDTISFERLAEEDKQRISETLKKYATVFNILHVA